MRLLAKLGTDCMSASGLCLHLDMTLCACWHLHCRMTGAMAHDDRVKAIVSQSRQYYVCIRQTRHSAFQLQSGSQSMHVPCLRSLVAYAEQDLGGPEVCQWHDPAIEHEPQRFVFPMCTKWACLVSPPSKSVFKGMIYWAFAPTQWSMRT